MTTRQAYSEHEVSSGISPPSGPGATVVPELLPGAADATRASQIANAEAKRQHDVWPFAPKAFRRTSHGDRVVFTAVTPFGLDELKAEVTFSTHVPPKVQLSILTSRHISPQIKTYEGELEIKDIRIEDIKIKEVE